MEFFFGGLDPWVFAGALAITLFAGFVKGAVGFAMPLIMISAFGAIMPPDVALAGLILPTLITNISQSLRQGWREAWASVRAFGWMIGMLVIFIPISAMFVGTIPQGVLLVMLGVPVTLFALAQILGRDLRVPVTNRRRAEVVAGTIGGLYGGVSGIWGPPVIVLLLSLNTPKLETVRVQGVVFLIGGLTLFLSHLGSGLMNATTIPFSAAMVVPAMAGMALGYALQDRLNPVRFRWWTLVLLAITGANLVRQGLMG